jgi:electron transfer flavoprotein alpha subunit
MAIWTVCEARGDDFSPTTYELLSQARKVGAAAGMETVAVVVGAEAELADKLNGKAHQVICLKGGSLGLVDAGSWAEALGGKCAEASPRLILFSDSDSGRELAPAIAAKLKYAVLVNTTGLEWEEDQFAITRPVCGGKAYATFGAGERGCVAVVRPNSFPVESGEIASTQLQTIEVDVAPGKVSIEELKPREGGKIPLTEAQVVVCGGRGMKAAENLSLLEDLAEVLGGAKGVSRAVVDAGWADHNEQVGKSGKTVSPKLYIVAGVSGAVHHTMGMDTSKVVVAINTDENAPIFRFADYGIVGDALEVLPAITKALRGE